MGSDSTEAERGAICFRCRQAVGQPAVINALPEGGPCPTCAERALEELPAALPKGWALRRLEGSDELESGPSLTLLGAYVDDDDAPEPA